MMSDIKPSEVYVSRLELVELLQEARAEIARLTQLAEVSEAFRQAYQDGKYKLYAMGGDICEAAAEHLPMSEGPLERAARRILIEPHVQDLRAEIARKDAEIERNNQVFNEVTITLISAIHARANERDALAVKLEDEITTAKDKLSELASDALSESLRMKSRHDELVAKLERITDLCNEDKSQAQIPKYRVNEIIAANQLTVQMDKKRMVTAEEKRQALLDAGWREWDAHFGGEGWCDPERRTDYQWTLDEAYVRENSRAILSFDQPEPATEEK